MAATLNRPILPLTLMKRNMCFNRFTAITEEHHEYPKLTRAFKHILRFKSGLLKDRLPQSYVYQRCHMHTQRNTPPWKILFFGTDDFSLPHLEVLHHEFSSSTQTVGVLEVVIPPKRKRHKLCTVGQFAEKQGLTIHEWPVAPPSGKFDVGVIVSFGHLLPDDLIQVFPHGILNVHPSLLPRWRGSAPLIHTVLNGDRETGVCVMQIQPDRFDVGPILQQKTYQCPEDITAVELRQDLSKMGAGVLIDTLSHLPSLEASAKLQSKEGATHAFKILPKHGGVNWELQSAQDVDRQYRALNGTVSLHSLWLGRAIKLHDMVPLSKMAALTSDLPDSCVPGTPVYHRPSQIVCVKCREGWVGFETFVIKKTMTALSFYNGYIQKPEGKGEILTSMENNLQKYFSKKER